LHLPDCGVIELSTDRDWEVIKGSALILIDDFDT